MLTCQIQPLHCRPLWTRIRRSPWQQIHSRNYRVSQLMYLGRITLSLFVLQTSKILRFNSTTPTASWTGSTEHVDRPMILTCRIDHIDWEFCCDSLQTQQVWLRTVRTKRHWCLTPNPLQKEEHQSRVHDLQSCFSMTVLIMFEKSVLKSAIPRVSWRNMLTERACTLCGAHSVLWARMLRVANRVWTMEKGQGMESSVLACSGTSCHQTILLDLDTRLICGLKQALCSHTRLWNSIQKICHGHDRTSSCCTILQSVHRVQACHAQCHECHACHAKRPRMWDCATPATWNQSGCHQVPRLPRKSAAASRATKRAQARHPVPWVPRLPRKTTVDVSLCHACHVKSRWMSPSATPATQKCRGVTCDQARQNSLLLLLLLTEGSFNRAGSIALRPCRLFGIASYKLLESWEDVRTTSPWLREIVCVDKQKASNVKFVCW